MSLIYQAHDFCLKSEEVNIGKKTTSVNFKVFVQTSFFRVFQPISADLLWPHALWSFSILWLTGPAGSQVLPAHLHHMFEVFLSLSGWNLAAEMLAAEWVYGD